MITPTGKLGLKLSKYEILRLERGEEIIDFKFKKHQGKDAIDILVVSPRSFAIVRLRNDGSPFMLPEIDWGRVWLEYHALNHPGPGLLQKYREQIESLVEKSLTGELK